MTEGIDCYRGTGGDCILEWVLGELGVWFGCEGCFCVNGIEMR
jgi:hypothetical protein